VSPFAKEVLLDCADALFEPPRNALHPPFQTQGEGFPKSECIPGAGVNKFRGGVGVTCCGVAARGVDWRG